MKKVVLFVLFLAVLVLVFMQPVVDAPAAPSHPLPLWSILCYLAVVALGAVVTALLAAGKRPAVRPERICLNERPGA